MLYLVLQHKLCSYFPLRQVAAESVSPFFTKEEDEEDIFWF